MYLPSSRVSPTAPGGGTFTLSLQSMSLGGPLELRCEPSLLHGEPTQLHAELPRPHDEHPRFRLDHLDIKTKQIC